MVDTTVVSESLISLSMAVETSRAQLPLLEEEQLVYLLAIVSPPDGIMPERLPLNLCLVLDRSTSMRGHRLSCVRQATQQLVDQMTPEDVFALIAFSDRATVVTPAAPINSKVRVKAQIAGIHASGGTEIFQGLEAGVQQLETYGQQKRLNRLILLTDGHTYGDEQVALDLAQRVARRGMGISALGLGEEWNDQFLDSLVAPSGGQSGFVETPEAIIGRLRKWITGLGAMYAQNLELRIDMPKGVGLRRAFRVAPYAQPLPAKVGNLKIGDIEGRTPVAVLLELVVAPRVVAERIEINLQVQADILGDNQAYTVFHDVDIPIVDEPLDPTPSTTLLDAVRIWNMYELNEKIWSDVEEGQLERATIRMRRLTRRLQEGGYSDLASHAEAETRRLAQAGVVSEAGHKRLKFGTRRMLTRTLRLSLPEELAV